MFGLGRVDGLNRREYNTRVRNILENRFCIDTDNQSNTNFPGLIVFGQLMDSGWNQRACPEDNAQYIALIYWSGCAKAGGEGLVKAKDIDRLVSESIEKLAESGKITNERARQFVAYYDEHCWLTA